MSTASRAFRAYVRLALVRQRRMPLIAITLGVLAVPAGAFLPMAGAAITVVIILVVTGLSTMEVPATLGSEKMFGTLEADRSLPIPIRVAAAGRLAGASARTGAMVFVASAVAIVVGRALPEVAPAALAVAALAALALYWAVLWMTYATIARFSSRWMVFLPTLLFIGVAAVPEAWWRRAGGIAMAALRPTLLTPEPSATMLATTVLAAIALTAASFLAAQALLVSGLRRFRHDPAAMAGAAPAPKQEMGAVGRGPVLAVTRLRLHLAAERFRRESILVAVMFALAIMDVGELSGIARTYLPIVAALMSMAIGFQLLQDRALGALESLQHLPHPRRLVALGHLLAIGTLCVPAVVVHVVSQVAEGADITPLAVVTRFVVYAASGSTAAAMIVWGTKRRFAILLGGAITIVILVALAGVVTAGAGGLAAALGPLIALAQWIRAPALAIALAMLVIAVSNELLARGIATYGGQLARS